MTLKVLLKAFPNSSALRFNYEQEKYLEAFNAIFQGLRQGANHIYYEDTKSGYNFYAFDLTPDSCNSESFSLVRDGSLDLDFSFAGKHNQSI
jgi:hypothetical protein